MPRAVTEGRKLGERPGRDRQRSARQSHRSPRQDPPGGGDDEGDRSAKNPTFVDAVARNNVVLTSGEIRRRSAVLNDLEKSGAIKIAGAMYSIDTAGLEFLG
jgi:carbonic anhydrase